MNKNEKGFTLVELIGVLVILAVIFTIAIPAISYLLDQSRGEIGNASKQVIFDATKDFIKKKEDIYVPDVGNTYCISFEQLIDNGMLSDEQIAEVGDYVNVQVKYDEKGNPRFELKDKTCSEVSSTAKLKLNGSKIVTLKLQTDGSVRSYVEEGLSFTYDEGASPITLTFRLSENTVDGLEISTTSNKSDDVVMCSTLTNCLPETEVRVYTIKYKYVSSDGDTYYAERIVKVVDEEAPVITIKEEEDTISSTTLSYDERAGVSVTDNSGETPKIVVKSGIKYGVPGTYIITYTATDSSGNTAFAKKTVTVKKNNVVNISVTPDTEKYEVGIDGYDNNTILDGVIAYDANGGNRTSDLTISIRKGNSEVTTINTKKIGTYVITYSLTLDGVNYNATRNIKVVDTIAPVIYLDSEIVYTRKANLDDENFFEGVSVIDNSGEKIDVYATVVGDYVDNKATVQYTAKDSSGNEAISVVRQYLKYDSATAPVLSGGSSKYSNRNVDIKVATLATSNDPISKYQYYISTSDTSLSGGSWTDLDDYRANITVSKEGIWYVYARAITIYGVEGDVSAPAIVKIDKTVPSAPTITGGSDSWAITSTGRTISVSKKSDIIGASGLSNYEYYVSTSKESPEGGKWISLGDGISSKKFSSDANNYVFFRSVNGAGTAGKNSNAQVIKIEVSKPSIPVITGGGTDWRKAGTNNTLALETASSSISNIDYYEYRAYKCVPSGEMSTSSKCEYLSTSYEKVTDLSNIFSASEVGNYTITVRAISKAGNKSSLYTTYIKLDDVTPYLKSYTLKVDRILFTSWDTYEGVESSLYSSLSCRSSSITNCFFNEFSTISAGDWGSGFDHVNLYINGKYAGRSESGNWYWSYFDASSLLSISNTIAKFEITYVDKVGNESSVLYSNERFFSIIPVKTWNSVNKSGSSIIDYVVPKIQTTEKNIKTENVNNTGCNFTIEYYFSPTEFYSAVGKQLIGTKITIGGEHVYDEKAYQYRVVKDCKGYIVDAGTIHLDK